MHRTTFAVCYFFKPLIYFRDKLFNYLAATVILTFHFSAAYSQYQKNEEPRPWWEAKDTSRFTPTGYLGASFGFVNDGSLSYNPALFIAAAEPLWKNFLGFACRAGYNAVPAAVTNTWFRQYYIAAGPFITYQLNKKFAFDLRILGGLMYCQYPEQIYLNTTTTSSQGGQSSSDSTIYYTFDIKSSSAFAFFYMAGLGFRFPLVRRTGLIFNADYMGLRADFNTTITSYTNGATVNTSNGSTITTHTYQFTACPVTSPLTIEPTDQHHNGYFLFTLGLYYRLGDPVLIK